MRRDQDVPGEKVAATIARNVMSAARIVVERWGRPWMHRPVAGEKLGVWLIGMIWIAAPVGLLVVLFG